MEDVREVGAEWLCKQTLEELGVGDYLRSLEWNENNIETALIELISRAVYPGSERKTAQWINENSAVAELFNRRADTINRFKLYQMSRKLYHEKEGLEKHLSVKTNELFDLEDKIILHDLTNKHADLNENTSYSERKPIVVMDAGIATDDNLKLLKSEGYGYVCVSRSRLKDYQFCEMEPVHLVDNQGNPIDARWIKAEEGEDQYLHIHSQMKAVKEFSINDHFCERYEEELDNVAQALHKKGGIKKYGKVMERIGRIKERYPTANKHYEVEVEKEDELAVALHWKRKTLSGMCGEGEYFLRTSLEQKDERLVWDIYNTIRNIEEVFRVLKLDLKIRPDFHQTDENTVPHLFLGVLAYSIVNTVRRKLKKQGIHYSWSNIIRIMNTQKTGTISMKKSDGKKVYLRLCSKPTMEVQKIYEAMGYKMMPFYRKKFVFPES